MKMTNLLRQFLLSRLLLTVAFCCMALSLSAQDYLCFTALKAGSTIKFQRVGNNDSNLKCYYSTTGTGSWKEFTRSVTVKLANVGDKIYMKNTGTSGTFSQSETMYYYFEMTGEVKASGNIMSLYKDDLSIKTMTTNGFYKLFAGCTALVDCSELVMPSNLAANCFESMFQGCTSLTAAPILPATKMASKCYLSMFEGCTSLLQAPGISAKTFATSCFQYMFRNCSSLNSVDIYIPTGSYSSAYFNGWLTGTASKGLLTGVPVYFEYDWEYNSYSWNAWSGTQTGDMDNIPVPSGWTKIANPNYLMFAAKSNSQFTFNAKGTPYNIKLQYSLDRLNWYDLNTGVAHDIASKGFAFFRNASLTDNKNFSKDASNYYYFTMSGKLSLAGNLVTLLTRKNVERDPNSLSDAVEYMYNVTFSPYMFYSLFAENSAIWAVDGLFDYAYSDLKPHCFERMFYHCTGLLNEDFTLKLHQRGKYASNAFKQTFMNCTSLGQANIYCPTIIENADSCFFEMYKGCTNMTSANVACAEVNSYRALYNTFAGCTRLTKVITEFKDVFPSGKEQTKGWLTGVPASGTFYSNHAIPTSRNADDVPSGWTLRVHGYSPSYYYQGTQNATCTTDGIRSCYVCNYCGKRYSDNELINERIDAVIPKTGHLHDMEHWELQVTYFKLRLQCSRCNQHYVDLDNTTNPKVVTTSTVVEAATCVNSGIIRYTGTVTYEGTKHTHSITDDIPIIPHDYERKIADAAYLASAATCTSGNNYVYVCTMCNKIDPGRYQWNDGKPLGHSYTDKSDIEMYQKSAATCTADAVYYYKCSRCGVKGTTTWVKTGSNFGGHDWSEYVVDVEATCTTDGTKTRHCNNPGCTETEQVVIPTGDHDYYIYKGELLVNPTAGSKGNWVLSDTKVSCNATGIQFGYDEASASQTVAVDASAYNQITVSCDYQILYGGSYHDGVAKIYVELLDADQDVIDTKYLLDWRGTDYEMESKETVSMDIDLPATTRYVRMVLEGRDQNRWGGNYGPIFSNMSMKAPSLTITKEPTCTEKGIGVEICQKCGHKVEEFEIPALGHEWGEYVVDVEVTCTTDGHKTGHCTRLGCTATEQAVIPATGHDYYIYKGELLVNPTAESDGNWELSSTGVSCNATGIQFSYDEASASQTVAVDASAYNRINVSCDYQIVYGGNSRDGVAKIYVELLDADQEVIDTKYLLDWSGKNYEMESKETVSMDIDLPAGTRYARMVLEGRDQNKWAGNYGPIFSNMSVKACFPGPFCSACGECKYHFEDIAILAQLILSGTWTEEQLYFYDINADGKLTIADQTLLVDVLKR